MKTGMSSAAIHSRTAGSGHSDNCFKRRSHRSLLAVTLLLAIGLSASAQLASAETLEWMTAGSANEALASEPVPLMQAGVAAEPIGKPRYRIDAATYFDRYAHKAAWIARHLDSFVAYPTYGDVYPKYGKPVVGYHDPATEGQHPLERPQIEAYVARARRDMQHGYAGPYVDDANWSFSPSPGPEANLANLIETLRREFPSAQIQINSQFNDIWPKMKEHDPNVERALRFVNIVTKEFGVGPTAGINTASEYGEFFQYVDTLHAKGVHISMTGDYGSGGNTVTVREYNLATYFLVNDGNDYVNGLNQTPGNWWKGFNVKLGEALGPRERSSSGIWTRRFSNGVVYTLEPGAATQTIQLAEPMRSAEWGRVTSVTLAAQQGAVLVKGHARRH
jgi:hypothetical protein